MGEPFPKSRATIRRGIAEAQEPTWRDWQRSRVHFLQYMGHGKCEAKKIAQEEMALLRNYPSEAPHG